MPGGALVEVVLVLLFVFVTMSAIVSSAQELLFQLLGWRSRKLRKTVETMLTDPEYKREVSRRVYSHPLIAGQENSRKHITWIEPKAFAQALAYAVQPIHSNGDPIDDLPHSVDALREGELKRRLQTLLPAASSAATREDIESSIASWFETAARKSGESYKADATAASYLIAAVVTVMLNVSPIEITQRLMADDALRTTFASAVPDLAPMLYNPGEGLPVATPAASAQSLADAPGTTPKASLKPEDLERILSLYKCAESRLSLPIGWEWMANAADALKATGDQNTLNGGDEAAACEKAIASAATSANAALADSLTRLQLKPTTKFEREYGPNFETDHPMLIFAGWLVMMIAAAQGAPFWFDLLKKFVARRV